MSRVEQFYEKAKQIVDSYTWLKVILIGDTKCGKTSIIKSYYDVSINNEYYPTIGIDYGFKLYRSTKSDITDEVRVNIWDFSGDPDFLETRKELYINTDIVIIVFDLSRPVTLDSVEQWIKEFQLYSNRKIDDIIIGIFANKSDLNSQRLVDIETGKRIAQSLNGIYFETSSKAKTNIQESFEYLIEATITRKLTKSK